MPTIQVNSVKIYYEDTAKGEETLVFSHGLLMNLHMFDDQIAHFRDRYRCVAYDHRGQGKSEVTEKGYDIDTIYEDAAALIEALDITPCHFVGLSMGGFVGMRLGARHPELLKSLVLIDTSADPEPRENLLQYNLLKFVARWISPRLIVNGAARSLFGRTFRTDPARREQLKRWKRHVASIDRVGGTKAAEGVFTRKPVYDEIASITLPTLVIVGDEDVATLPEKAERISRQMPNSRLVVIPRAGHCSSIEQPEAVNIALDEFYSSLS